MGAQSVGDWPKRVLGSNARCRQNLGEVLVAGEGDRTISVHYQGTFERGTEPGSSTLLCSRVPSNKICVYSLGHVCRNRLSSLTSVLLFDDS